MMYRFFLGMYCVSCIATLTYASAAEVKEVVKKVNKPLPIPPKPVDPVSAAAKFVESRVHPDRLKNEYLATEDLEEVSRELRAELGRDGETALFETLLYDELDEDALGIASIEEDELRIQESEAFRESEVLELASGLQAPMKAPVKPYVPVRDEKSVTAAQLPASSPQQDAPAVDYSGKSRGSKLGKLLKRRPKHQVSEPHNAKKTFSFNAETDPLRRFKKAFMDCCTGKHGVRQPLDLSNVVWNEVWNEFVAIKKNESLITHRLIDTEIESQDKRLVSEFLIFLVQEKCGGFRMEDELETA